MNELITLKHLKLYAPENPPVAKAFYLQSDEGADWYQAQIHFSPDSRKIVYTDDGRIIFQHVKEYMLWPENLSVSEVLEDDLPEGFPASDEPCPQWLFIDGKVIPKPVDYVLLAKNEKSERLAEATAAIAILQDAVDIGNATDNETALLLEWKKYRVAVNRVDASKAPAIEWPDKPVSE